MKDSLLMRGSQQVVTAGREVNPEEVRMKIFRLTLTTWIKPQGV